MGTTITWFHADVFEDSDVPGFASLYLSPPSGEEIINAGGFVSGEAGDSSVNEHFYGAGAGPYPPVDMDAICVLSQPEYATSPEESGHGWTLGFRSKPFRTSIRVHCWAISQPL